MLNVLEILLLCLLLQAAITDLAWRRIPNLLVLGGLLLAFALRWKLNLPLLPALGGMAAGALLFLPLYLRGAMAAGDVKLLIMVGAFTGPLGALQIAWLAFLIGGVLALLALLARPPRRRLPYGVAVALGGLLLVAWAHRPLPATAQPFAADQYPLGNTSLESVAHTGGSA
ncbi:prepilin peptidase [Pseudoduganella violacea]|uniref:Prepilin peptidase CpaA n=1 Tax=Pseudoduganella violacea TaxID=1715466 RepID=A0A7W5B5V5_9BURK|nr:A24 family peptidase [Pseudoduganella violacea]MBB3117011.1 prepilin peptidase CpaA [Pseudoduganella violacea]